MSGRAVSATQQALIKAMLANGDSIAHIARELDLNRQSVAKYRHSDLLDPDYLDHIDKTLASKAKVAADAMISTILDQAESGELAKAAPTSLAKGAAVMIQSASALTALKGATDTISDLLQNYGVQASHSVSRLTMEKKVTVDSTGEVTASMSISQAADIPVLSKEFT